MGMLQKRGLPTDQICAVCKQVLETHQLLVFSCTMAVGYGLNYYGGCALVGTLHSGLNKWSRLFHMLQEKQC